MTTELESLKKAILGSEDPETLIEEIEAAGVKGYSVPGIGSIRSITTESYLGNDQGNICFIFCVNGGLFYRLTGYYDSWAGIEWKEGAISQVVPYEEIITVYRDAGDDDA